jgi:hypothetical protein
MTGGMAMAMGSDRSAGPATAALARPRRWAGWLGAALGVALLVAAYYGGGALWLHRIDDDPAFGTAAELPPEASRAVAVAADLVAREVDSHRWVANDPWFQPAFVLDNMPHYQTGITAAVSRFAVELTDHLSRVRGASMVDPDADAAAGRLKYPGDVWILEWSATPVQPSSESQYRSAVEHLRRYNERLAQGRAVFERRADNLIATLERIAADTGSSSAALFERIDASANAWYDLTADDLFYNVKGRTYAYLLLLRGLGEDFRGVLGERAAQRNWDELLRSFEAAATLQPWVVVNGGLDSLVRPNHLASQGFLLLRARFQLYEVINILTK